MIRIYTEAEKKLHRYLRRRCVLLSLIIPVLCVLVLNTIELLLYYNSNVYSNIWPVGLTSFMYIGAQVLSVARNVILTASLMCSLALLCASCITFGVGKSKLAVISVFLSRILIQLCNFAVLYILVYTGNHDYTPLILDNNISVLFDVAVISTFVYLLVILACFIFFYFSDKIRSESFSSDKSFVKKVKIVCLAIASIKLISYIYDLICYRYYDSLTVNSAMTDIILPLVYIILEFTFGYFAVKAVIEHVDKVMVEWQVDLIQLTKPVKAEAGSKKEKRRALIKKRADDSFEKSVDE